MKTKEFTFVNDCFHDESNAVVDVFLLTLSIVIFRKIKRWNNVSEQNDVFKTKLTSFLIVNDGLHVATSVALPNIPR